MMMEDLDNASKNKKKEVQNEIKKKQTTMMR